MAISRRDIAKLLVGGSAAAAVAQLGRGAALAQSAGGYRAMVGVYLIGGMDGFNAIVPTDGRYAAYAAGRGPSLAVPQASLVPLAGSPFGLHPALAPLKQAWADGAMNVVLNTGSLVQPTDKTLYQTRPDLMPLNLMSHADEAGHWQGLHMRDANQSGFMGRIGDRMGTYAVPPVISIAGSNLALLGESSSPLILPSGSMATRNGYSTTATDSSVVLRQAAINTFADGTADGTITGMTGQGLSSAYSQAATATGILNAATSPVDAFFVDATGAPLTSDISQQLLRVARMIVSRGTLGHDRQVFFVSPQDNYDTHEGQTVGGDPTQGTEAQLLGDLATAMAGFYAAMKGMGLSSNVTTFTMSDFGRVYRGNASNGSDHGWGNNHIVLGGGLGASRIQGAYPDQTLGGPADAIGDGRWIPSIAIEEYLSAIVNWYGVAASDLPYIFPNWSAWNGGGRGPVPLFG
jgi:uncharacterized protein (DUF1501 family)